MTPAWHPHVMDLIHDELRARAWDIDDLAARMGGKSSDEYEIGVNRLTLELLDKVRESTILLSEATAQRLGLAFGIPASFFVAVHNGWRAYSAGPPKHG